MHKFSRLVTLIALLPAAFVHSQEEYRGLISPEFRNRSGDYHFHLTRDLIGARGLAMGGANIAAVNDLSALFFNPAALTMCDGLEATLSGRMNFDTRENDHPPLSGIAATTEIKPLLDPSYAALGYSLALGQRRLSAAVAYSYFNDMNIDYETIQYSYGGGRIQEEDDINGGVQTISPGLALDILPQSLSLGCSYNSILGGSNYEYRITSPYADDFLYFQFRDKEEYSGSFVSFGLKASPVEWLNIGASFTPRWTLTVEEKSESLNLFQGLTSERDIETTPADRLSTFDFDIPLRAGLGLAFKPLSSMTFSFDATNQSWSDIEVVDSVDEENPFLTQLADVFNWHAGFEHVVTSGTWHIPLRLGLFSTQCPDKDRRFLSVFEGDQLVENGWSFGFGVGRDPVNVNFAFMHRSHKFEWWMQASDYYNKRIFTTIQSYNQIFLEFSYRL